MSKDTKEPSWVERLEAAHQHAVFIVTLDEITAEIKVLSPQAKAAPQIFTTKLKPLATTITNSPPYFACLPAMQEALNVIIRYTIELFTLKTDLGLIEFLEELLDRSHQVFVHSAGPSSQDLPLSRRNLSRNFFHQTCFETILEFMRAAIDKFNKYNVVMLISYYKAFKWLKHHASKEGLMIIALESITKLQALFRNPSVANCSFVEFEQFMAMCEAICWAFLQLGENMPQERVYFLILLMAESLLDCGDEQLRISTCKMLSSFVNHLIILRKNDHGERLGKWLRQNKIFERIFHPESSLQVVKASAGIFRGYLRFGTIDKNWRMEFFRLLDVVPTPIRKLMIRYFDAINTDFYYLCDIFEWHDKLKPIQFYTEEFFLQFQAMAGFSVMNHKKKMMDLFFEVQIAYGPRLEADIQARLSTAVREVTKKMLDSGDRNGLIEYFKKFYREYFLHKSVNLSKPAKEVLIEIRQKDKTLLPLICAQVINFEGFADQYFELMKVTKEPGIASIEDLTSIIIELLNTYGKGLVVPKDIEALLEDPRVGLRLKAVLITLLKPEEAQQITKTILKGEQTALPQEVLRQLFYLANAEIVQQVQISSVYFHKDYQIKADPESLYLLEEVIAATNQHPSQQVKTVCCDLIAEAISNCSFEHKHQEQALKERAIREINHKIQKFRKGEFEPSKIGSLLTFINKVMLSSEHFGLGSVKAHNSHAVMQTTALKIQNFITNKEDEENDAPKFYERIVPTNWTLFELLTDLAIKFKCAPHEMVLRTNDSNGNIYHSNMNGMTLSELQFTSHNLIVEKAARSRLKTYPLVVGDHISDRAVAAFTEIFARFSKADKIGKKQCANFISKATGIYCMDEDQRVASFMRDLGKDAFNQEDFIRHFTALSLDIERSDNVWRKLTNLGYRADLKMNTQPYQIRLQSLVRFRLSQNPAIYETLFSISSSSDQMISEAARSLLMQLPTSEVILAEVDAPLNIKLSDGFLTFYRLLALVNFLHSGTETEKVQKRNILTSKSHHSALAGLVSSVLDPTQLPSQQHSGLMLAIGALRLLISVPDLSQQNLAEFKPALLENLPPTPIYKILINEALKNSDFSIFEPSLALQLTQSDLEISILKEGYFHHEKLVRVSTCNFLKLWQLKHNYPLDLFAVQIADENNDSWYSLLTSMVELQKNLNFQNIVLSQVSVLTQAVKRNKSTDLKKANHSDTRLAIVLDLLAAIAKKVPLKDSNQLKSVLFELCLEVVCSESRTKLYALLDQLDSQRLLDYLDQESRDIKVASLELEPKQHFVGLKNLGCLCYMNSILQEFFMIQDFRNLIDGLHIDELPKPISIRSREVIDDFCYQLQKLFAWLQFGEMKFHDPIEFCCTVRNPQGNPVSLTLQEDAHQFLNYVFRLVQKQAKAEEKLNQLESIFGGKTMTEIQCLSCSNKILREESYYHLTVEVKGLENLAASLARFEEPEEISDYHCEHCAKRVQLISKKIRVHTSPSILILNLRRIIYEGFQLRKEHSKMEFPHQLRLSEGSEFRLKGVVIHSGTSVGGHYYSIIRDGSDWFKFNDQTVTPFDISLLPGQAFGGNFISDPWGDAERSTNAYILFYEKKEAKSAVMENQANPFKDEVQKQAKEAGKYARMVQPSIFKFISSKWAQVETKTIQSIDKAFNNQVTFKQFENIAIRMLKFLHSAKLQSNEYLSYKSLMCSMIRSSPQVLQSIVVGINKDSLILLLSADSRQARELLLKIWNQALNSLDNLIVMSTNPPYQYLFTKVIQEVAKILKGPLSHHLPTSKQFLSLLISISQTRTGKSEIAKGSFCGLIISAFTESPNREEVVPIQLCTLISQCFRAEMAQAQSQGVQFPSQTLLDQLTSITFFNRLRLKRVSHYEFGQILAKICVSNRPVSEKVAKLYLHLVSDEDSIMLANLLSLMSSYLLISDQLQQLRIEWVLGIAQPSLTDEKQISLDYYENKQWSYVSPLKFQPLKTSRPLLEMARPALEHHYSSAYNYVSRLIELMVKSPLIRNFVQSQQGPNYNFHNYSEIIFKELERLCSMQTQTTKQADEVLFKLISLKQELDIKICEDSNPNRCETIVGNNRMVDLVFQFESPMCYIAVYEHETWVMSHKQYIQVKGDSAQGVENVQETDLEMKRKIFKAFFSSHHAPVGPYEEGHYSSAKTYFRCEVKPHREVAVQFSLLSFNHQIHFGRIPIFVMIPYTANVDWSECISVRSIESEKQAVSSIVEAGQLLPPELSTDNPKADIEMTSYDEPTVFCKFCSCENPITRQTCETCYSALFD